MVVVSYEKIEENIKKYNNSILVLKDNAYGFGIKKVANIAISNNHLMFAVGNVSEANSIYNLSNKAYIIILGPPNSTDQRFVYSVGDMDDYVFCVKNKLSFHMEINISMNRFGFDNLVDNVYNNPLCEGIYFHSNTKNTNKDYRKFESLIKNIKRKDLIYHIGGSEFLNMKTKYYIRYGEALYQDAFRVCGNVIKLRRISNSNIGYNAKFIKKNSLVATIDIGYSDILLRNAKDTVIIGNKKYKTVGFKCMDYTFAMVDSDVKVGDIVEFINFNHDRINHEVYLSQKR